MKALKIIGVVVGGLLLLGVLLVAVALTPAVQKWAVHRAVANDPDAKLEVSRLAAGLNATEIRDLRYEKAGMIVSAKAIQARYSAWDYLTQDRLQADEVVIQDLVLDLRQVPAEQPGTTTSPGTSPAPGSAGSPPPAQPASSPAGQDPAEPFRGLLEQAKLPFDVQVGSVTATGRALLPNQQTVVFELKGGGIGTGRRGQLQWTVDFADGTSGAALRGLRSTGTVQVQVASDRRVDLVEVETVASAVGPNLPPDRIQLNARAEQATAGGNEGYQATVAMVRGTNSEPLLKVNAQYLAAAREISGAWDLTLRTEQSSRLLTGLGLPPLAANGAGKFALKPDAPSVDASGELQAEASDLGKLNPALAGLGRIQLQLAFDGGLAGEKATLARLNLVAADGDGRRFAEIVTTQPVGYELDANRVTFVNPDAELARVSLQSLPLAWAQPVVPLTIESGDLSLRLAVTATPDGSRVVVSPVEPVSLRAVTLRQGEQRLIENLALSVRPHLDYAGSRATARLSDLTITTPGGDAVNGRVDVDATNLEQEPAINFVTDLRATLATLHQAYVPVKTGPLTITLANRGRLEGDRLAVEQASATVNREGDVLLTRFELQQPIRADLAAGTFTAEKPEAVAARLTLGEVPLAWAEAFVENAQLQGAIAGTQMDVTFRSPENITVTTSEPLRLTRVSATLDGQAMAREVDLSASLTATKRGDAITYELSGFELRQGPALLARFNAAGEAQLGEKLAVSAKGSLEADVPALMNQPVLASFATLSRGQLRADFDGRMADAIQAKASIAATQLVAKQDNRALGDLQLTLDAQVKPDGSGNLTLPLTLANAQRKSDLLVQAAFGKAPGRETFLLTGKVSSQMLVVDDFQPLAGLAPSGGPEEKPTAHKPTRDEQPFWSAVNGKLELDLKQVVYGPSYVISNVRGATTITDSRLALDGLEGQMNNNPFKLAANVTFAAQQPQPYTLAGTANVTNFRIGELLRASNPNQPPPLESTVNIVADIKGNGATVADLAKNVYGRFDLTGTQGVLRALGRKGEVASVGSAILGIAGALTGSQTTSAVGELTAALAELKFDTFKMQVERGADLSLKLTNIEFISPIMRTTGSGSVANQPGVEVQNQPMQIQLQFGAKGGLQHLLSRVNALGQQVDPQGYALLQRTFTVGGTPANPDSSSFWQLLLREAAALGAPALQDLLNRRR